MEDLAFEQWTSSLKDVSMEDVTAHLGIEIRSRGQVKQILCPFHADHHYGSCMIKNNYMHCFACGASADNIQLVMQVKGLPWKEAAVEVSEIAGLDNPWESSEKSYRKMPLTYRQLKLLGLHPSIKCFEPIGWTDCKMNVPQNFIIFPDFDPSKDTDGYIFGQNENVNIADLYDNDKDSFNRIITGKIWEVLIEDISDCMAGLIPEGSKAFWEQIDIIDELIPLAYSYKNLARKYGIDYSFLRDYKVFRDGLSKTDSSENEEPQVVTSHWVMSF